MSTDKIEITSKLNGTKFKIVKYLFIHLKPNKKQFSITNNNFIFNKNRANSCTTISVFQLRLAGELKDIVYRCVCNSEHLVVLKLEDFLKFEQVKKFLDEHCKDQVRLLMLEYL